MAGETPAHHHQDPQTPCSIDLPGRLGSAEKNSPRGPQRSHPLLEAPHHRPTAPAHPPERLPTTQQLVKESCTVLDLTNTLLSAQISRRSSCPSNSAVQPGSSPPSLRAAARRCQSMRYPAATSLLSWRACLSSRRKHASGRGTSFPSSSSRKRGWTGSGSTASCRRKGSRAMSSIPPPSRRHGGVGGQRLTGSTAKPWFALC